MCPQSHGETRGMWMAGPCSSQPRGKHPEDLHDWQLRHWLGMERNILFTAEICSHVSTLSSSCCKLSLFSIWSHWRCASVLCSGKHQHWSPHPLSCYTSKTVFLSLYLTSSILGSGLTMMWHMIGVYIDQIDDEEKKAIFYWAFKMNSSGFILFNS